jgi:hypothetical protein
MIHGFSHSSSFLIREYGFQVLERQVVSGEASMVFQNDTTRITVNCVGGTTPFVSIYRLKDWAGKRVPGGGIALELLLEGRQMHSAVPAFETRDLSESERERVLSAKAKALQAAADDLLRGNFESWPELMKEVDKEARRRRLELYGTEEE